MKNKNWLSRRVIHLNPAQILMLGFMILIIIGGFLFKLPIATHGGISWINAFFTSTSATTVTGLSVISTGTNFTLFGQIIILFLMQIGGVGFMSVGVLIILTLGKRIGLKQRLVIKEALNQTSVGGVIRLVKKILLLSAVIETIGVIFLMLRWVPDMGFWKGIYYSIFYVVAAYNNAGFSLWPNSLSRYASDPVVNIVIPLLFIIGGIGFTVLTDIWNSKDFKSLTLHSKLTIVGTIGLTIFGMLMVLILEFNNTKTLGHLNFTEKLWASFFQGATPRSAGFNTLNYNDMNETTLLLTIFLMFIGAGSASAGGGIKVTTFFIILISVVGFITGRENPVVFGRWIKKESLSKAMAIFVLSQTFIFIGVCALMLTEQAKFLPTLFEVVSAFSTSGLSMGLTPHLSAIGKVILIFIMYTGLVGPLTLFFSLSQPKKSKIRYPSEDIMTG
ncbi:trk system potassium uptake protein TrkH [Pullulanibacillus pueri]|uniref:Ktr system potassium transporter B n=1 Tax=Pullulanibacillus pueri TaxID=1437324 RepID=A0A8J3A0R7_9BACL|nr:TrkH family potassium uptake protein [Pullulanibacillus pueri]MBM7683817.1 trk system potassium uptake protein TrkH [Pullulanibacillus pueri]GGH87685.1 Ktr system potassium transporter B [Pullulanibacillus pueri]